MKQFPLLSTAIALAAPIAFPAFAQTLTGQGAFTDFSKEHPGVRRKITVADLPQPYSTESFDDPAHIVPRPEGEWPQALTGFVTPKGEAWGRPVGVGVAKDGSLFVSDDGSNSIWHVTHTGSRTARSPIKKTGAERASR